MKLHNSGSTCSEEGLPSHIPGQGQCALRSHTTDTQGKSLSHCHIPGTGEGDSTKELIGGKEPDLNSKVI